MMIMADKIIQLRKQFGWSQENLADALNVSRQSVSKWESGNSIPDLNKILKMAELFGVTTDYLLKDDIVAVETAGPDSDPHVVKLSIEDVNAYAEAKVKAAKMISKGVMTIIYAVIPLFMMLALSEGNMISISEDAAVLIGISSLLVIVASGVAILIHSNRHTNDIDKLAGNFELSYGVEGVVKEKLNKYLPKFTTTVSIAVAEFILSVLPLLYAGIMGKTDAFPLFMLAFMFLLIGHGVYMLVNVSARKDAYEMILKQGEFAPEKIEENEEAEKLGAFYWPLVVAIYLGWSFWTYDWHITWIVWPVAGLVFAALTGLVQMFKPKEKN